MPSFITLSLCLGSQCHFVGLDCFLTRLASLARLTEPVIIEGNQALGVSEWAARSPVPPMQAGRGLHCQIDYSSIRTRAAPKSAVRTALTATAPHQVEEFRIGLGSLHLVKNELHRFDLVHAVQQLAQNPDLLQHICLDQ